MGKNKELISIIVPVYNSQRYIEECIASVISQSYTNWELIIVDDCSTDNTMEIVRGYLAEHDIIIFYNDKNLGAALSRNKGLSHARGKYIAFLDSDDKWTEDKLMVQLAFMKKSSYAISFHSYALINEKGNTLNILVRAVSELSYYDYLKNTNIGFSTSMINVERLGSVEFHNIRTRQDTLFWLHLLAKGHVAHGINDVLSAYRVRSKSISSNKFKAAWQVWIVYYKYQKLGFLRALYFYLFYVYNAVKKRF